ncbi:hypothetical protein [Pseudomonas sp. LFM046]|uniref:hypothetical protein n=1 Tax=Pseudomonas sp. LFM046 TaxID=1608357 RepID=UPI0005CF92F8|nr:hypothetical protein [Pseudomonas sp. LFM046]
MGYWLCALLWGLVLLEEVQCIPLREWKADGMSKVLMLRRTRTKGAYLLALAAGAFCLSVETSQVLLNRSDFDFNELVALASVLWGGYLAMLCMKGKR